MKKKFLESEFGKQLVSTITTWDEALEKNRRTEEDKDILRILAWCQAQWEVYRMAIKHFYGVEYHFTRTDEYYGLCTEDESDWLMKVDRELTFSHRYKVTAEDVNDRKRRREALRKALQETMEVVLESELFINAAQRGNGDYEIIVSNNIPMMTDSVLGIYERILHKVGD